MQPASAAGSVYSAVEDLLKWDQAACTKRLLRSTAEQLMWTPFKNNYAFGWIIGEPTPVLFGGHRRIVHTGDIDGFSCAIVRLAEPNVTLIVLANNDDVNVASIARDIAAIDYGQPYNIPAPRLVATVNATIYDEYAGKYEMGPGSVLAISREGNALMVASGRQAKFELFPSPRPASL